MHRYFYGIKVQLITTNSGIPVKVSIVADSQAGLHQLIYCLPVGNMFYVNLAYNNYYLEDMLADEQIKLYSQCEN
jgi:hypothetical protein